MMAARNLEVTHRVDVNVMATQEHTHHVDDKLTTVKEVIHDVDGDVKETKELTRDVRDDVKVTRHSEILSRFHTFHPPCLSFVETVIDEQQRSLHPGGFIADCHR